MYSVFVFHVPQYALRSFVSHPLPQLQPQKCSAFSKHFLFYLVHAVDNIYSTISFLHSMSYHPTLIASVVTIIYVQAYSFYSVKKFYALCQQSLSVAYSVTVSSLPQRKLTSTNKLKSLLYFIYKILNWLKITTLKLIEWHRSLEMFTQTGVVVSSKSSSSSTVSRKCWHLNIKLGGLLIVDAKLQLVWQF